ncbi:MAG: phytanoyl-CoA dioxygenase family protein [Spirochaetaceae bacterium]|nr:phytanoyl-CoA dioxygenase family protein [Spirochaetaceae bacterium]
MQVPEMKAGDCSLHLGWTVHGAPANRTDKVREAMTVNYFPDGARITDMSRSPDGLRFVGGLLPGQLAASVMNPIVYSEQDEEAEEK